MTTVAALARGPRHPSRAAKRLAAWLGRAELVLLLALSLLVYAQFRFWTLPTEGDTANWDYLSQVIARGGVPYRDAVNQKTPLSAYIGAAAILAFQPWGVRDVIALRLVYVGLALATIALTGVVARRYLDSRRIAFLAGLIVLGFDAFAIWNSSGVESKTPMVLFGLLTLYAVDRRRPLLAGFSGMLSALCWQAGLLYVGVGLLAFSRYLARWRDGAVSRLLVGAAVPLALTLAYFAAQGALWDFYLWTVHFNSAVYAPRMSGEGATLVGRLDGVLERYFERDWAYFALAALGVVLLAGQEARRVLVHGMKALREAAPRHAMLVAPLAYLGFCLISFQGGRDLVPLLPFVAIFAAALMVRGSDYLASRLPASGGRAGGVLRVGVFLSLCVLVFMGSVADAFAFRVGSPTLRGQDAGVAEIVSHLEPGDGIMVHDAAAVLVLGGLQNATKFFYLQRYLGDYLDRTEPGGFAGWLERLKAQRPKVVVLGVRPYTRPEAIAAWLEADYVVVKARIKYYLRRDAYQKRPRNVDEDD